MNLRIIYNDKISSFEKDAFVSIHIRNLQVLVSDIFKINRNISSSIRNGIFESRAEHTYNFRCVSQFSAPLVSTVFDGTESISCLVPTIWSLLLKTFQKRSSKH